jgi:hypothetical protein
VPRPRLRGHRLNSGNVVNDVGHEAGPYARSRVLATRSTTPTSRGRTRERS